MRRLFARNLCRRTPRKRADIGAFGDEEHKLLAGSAMKTLHCTHCQNLVFFENVRCLRCDHALAYLPAKGVMAALEERPDGTTYAIGSGTPPQLIRRCANYAGEHICNWALQDDDDGVLCRSCRLTEVIPDLSKPENRVAWYKLESAKRRMLYSLYALRLPVAPRSADPKKGLAFRFLENSARGDTQRVLTGHDNGLITVNVAEADDVQREQQRTAHQEAYRTLLGHFRHEIGHYYWDVLIQNGARLEAFRALFGDERADYQKALDHHYQNGAPEDWPENFVSAYATMHPWEDWAECWAHFLHMTDTLQTARAAGLALNPRRADEPALTLASDPLKSQADFNGMVEDWSALTYVLNNLNRGLGLPDGYPFILTAPVIAKIAFVHQTIVEAQDTR